MSEGTSERDEMLHRKSLYIKLSAIRDSMERIPKNGYNDFHKYKYATEDDVTTHLRKQLKEVKLGLTVRASGENTVQSMGGKCDANLTTVTVIFRIVDLDTGFYEDLPFYGKGEDKGDKGIYKAYTGAVKYFLMKNFLMSTGDDPENDGKDKKNKNEKNRGVIVDAQKNIQSVKDKASLDKVKADLNKLRWTKEEQALIVTEVQTMTDFFAKTKDGENSG